VWGGGRGASMVVTTLHDLRKVRWWNLDDLGKVRWWDLDGLRKVCRWDLDDLRKVGSLENLDDLRTVLWWDLDDLCKVRWWDLDDLRKARWGNFDDLRKASSLVRSYDLRKIRWWDLEICARFVGKSCGLRKVRWGSLDGLRKVRCWDLEICARLFGGSLDGLRKVRWGDLGDLRKVRSWRFAQVVDEILTICRWDLDDLCKVRWWDLDDLQKVRWWDFDDLRVRWWDLDHLREVRWWHLDHLCKVRWWDLDHLHKVCGGIWTISEVGYARIDAEILTIFKFPTQGELVVEETIFHGHQARSIGCQPSPTYWTHWRQSTYRAKIGFKITFWLTSFLWWCLSCSCKYSYIPLIGSLETREIFLWWTTRLLLRIRCGNVDRVKPVGSLRREFTSYTQHTTHNTTPVVSEIWELARWQKEHHTISKWQLQFTVYLPHECVCVCECECLSSVIHGVCICVHEYMYKKIGLWGFWTGSIDVRTPKNLRSDRCYRVPRLSRSDGVTEDRVSKLRQKSTSIQPSLILE
jgi:hypothetical protein